MGYVLQPIRVVRFSVPGTPKGWQRAGSNRYTGVRYTPTAMRAEQNGIRVIAAAAMRGQPPHTGPVRLGLLAVFEPPSSWPQWKVAAALDGLILPTSGVDYDNIEKQIFDSIRGIVYDDDVRVVGPAAEPDSGKVYGTPARIDVWLELLPNIATKAEANATRGDLGGRS